MTSSSDVLERLQGEVERCEDEAWTWIQLDVDDAREILATIERLSAELERALTVAANYRQYQADHEVWQEMERILRAALNNTAENR
jgi:hypothetical protein